jgi:hypothetical protein
MKVIFIITLAVSTLLVMSLRACKKEFNYFTAICIYLFCSHMCQQFFYVYYSAYKKIEVVPKHLEFWISRMDYGIILPILLVWALYLFKRLSNTALKALALFSWAITATLYQGFRIYLGVLILEAKWSFIGTFTRMLIVTLLSVLFVSFLTKLMIQEKVIS